ncbi:MAG: mechanosensitive ion channel family protein [Acidiferrobacterales bacterium]
MSHVQSVSRTAATRRVRRHWLTVLLSAFLLFSPSIKAQDDSKKLDPLDPQRLAQQLNRIDRALARAPVGEATASEWLKLVNQIKDIANRCVPTAETALEKTRQDLFSLGAHVDGEPIEVTRQRKALDKEKTTLETRLTTCRVALQRSEEILPKIRDLQQQLRAQRLFARGPTILALLKDEGIRPAALITASKTFVRVHSGVSKLSAERLAVLAFVLVVAVTIGGLLRQQLMVWARHRRWQTNLSSYLGRSLVTGFGYYAPHLLFSITVAIFFASATWQVRPIPFLTVVAFGLPPYFLVLTLIHVFLAPRPPADAFLPIPKDVAKALARSLKVSVLLVFVGYLLFATLLAQALPEPAILLARALFAVVLFVNLTRVVWLLGKARVFARTVWLRLALLLILIVALVDELVGYRNFSFGLLRAILGTLFAAGFLLLAQRLFREFYDGLDQGRDQWHRRLRQALTLTPQEPILGLRGLRVITTAALWLLFGFAMIYVWALPPTWVNQLYEYSVQGFDVGSLRVNPARIVLAIVVLAILLALNGWIRSRLSRRWLPRTRMERGTREATVTMGSYIGIAIAFLVALAVSGFEFANIAIIAGALSVGIGFGLQNVVNNFVSGLILLFERPIKTGDWIVVGNTEGYVKRIRIRSTEIQTFDRADVIVPNSDLISNQVTNWMLREPRGRLKVPVGVAYGSDTEQVRDLLHQVAEEHPSVITDGSVPKPMVLFLGFGDSALSFELRCFIEQIDYRLAVISDINFAIDKAFREHGIQIPFPQRDVHVRSLPTVQQQPAESRTSRAAKRPSRSATQAAKDGSDAAPAED